MENNIDARIATIHGFTTEKQLEFANSERIRLAIALVDAEKKMSIMAQEIMWLKSSKGDSVS